MEQSYKTKAGFSKFRKHLRSIKQEDVENITNTLDEELANSQKAMDQIAGIFESLNKLNNNDLSVHNLPPDAIAKFLEDEPLKLVPPELIGVQSEGEVDEIMATMKMAADKLNKKPMIEPQTEFNKSVSNLEPLESVRSEPGTVGESSSLYQDKLEACREQKGLKSDD